MANFFIVGLPLYGSRFSTSRPLRPPFRRDKSSMVNGGRSGSRRRRSTEQRHGATTHSNRTPNCVEALKTSYRSENAASFGCARCGITDPLTGGAGNRFEHSRAISLAKYSAYDRLRPARRQPRTFDGGDVHKQFFAAGWSNEPKAFLPTDFEQPSTIIHGQRL